MQVRVLGCSGGIGARARTTSFLVDHDILLDAGTGVEDLSVEELAGIDHVFLTHSHLDHIAALPLLVDSVGETLKLPTTAVTAPPEEILAGGADYVVGVGRVGERLLILIDLDRALMLRAGGG